MIPNQDILIQRFRERLQKNPASVAFVPLADVLESAGDREGAIQCLREGLAHRPNHGPGLVVLGKALLADGQNDDAVRHLQKALEITPDNLVALRLLVPHFMKGQNISHALPLVERLIELEPENEKWQAAQREIRAGLVIPPAPTAVAEVEDKAPLDARGAQDELATLTLVDIMISQGYVDKALAALHSIEEKDPGRSEVLDRIRKLESRKSGRSLEIRPNLVTSTMRSEQRARQKKEFGDWIQGLKPDQGGGS